MASKRGLLDLGVAVASVTAGYYFYSRNEFWFGQPNNPDATRNPSDFDKTFAALQEIQKQEKNETAQKEPTENDVMQWIKSEIIKWR